MDDNLEPVQHGDDGEFNLEPVQVGDNGQFEHGEQQFDMEDGFMPDGFHEGNVMGNSVAHRDSSPGKLFVGGVSWETTEENFAYYFRNYGEVIDSVIMLDKHSGRPRGFGFVTFADPAVADKVLEEDHVIDGKMVEVKRTVPREDMEFRGVSRTKKIFVGGIPPSLSNEELREYFSPYGGIVDCQIKIDHKSGKSRGFGFVTFDNEDAVERIFSVGKKHELGGRQVEIKRAEPKRSGKDYNGNESNDGFDNTAAGHDWYNYGCGQYSGYGGYGNFGGGYAGFYSGYGGYLYGFGYGGAMYGGDGYRGSGYGMLGGYGGISAYNHYGEYDRHDGVMAARYHPYRR